MKKFKLYALKRPLALLIVSVFFILAEYKAYAQGVSVNTTGSPPHPSAIFDASSTNQGALFPRMTSAQRDSIQSPAYGLIIFNTDCGVFNFNASSTSTPNWATLNSSNALVAGVSIAASPAGAVCPGTSVTFTATPANGINSPGYQWQVNGGNVGSNNATYTSSTLDSGNVVTCILSTNSPCVSGSPATSNPITVALSHGPATPGSITGNANVSDYSSGNIYFINSVSGANSYNWTVPAGATITANSDTTITVSFGSPGTGNITVSATNSCGTSAYDSLPVTINPTVTSFTNTGTTSWTAPSGVTSIQVLVVAGGGGGNNIGGGGGAGGVVYNSSYSVIPGNSYTVTVGAGGANDPTGNEGPGFQGGNSVFDNITAIGGGASQSNGDVCSPGGSGGGGFRDGTSICSGTAGQGNSGGQGANNDDAGGGGGGAGGSGGNGSGTTGGTGGPGIYSSITGSPVAYGGGGGGGTRDGAGGTGGVGGGGSAPNISGNGNPGTPNTGGGGGSGSFNGTYYTGGPGGSGIVIISY